MKGGGGLYAGYWWVGDEEGVCLGRGGEEETQLLYVKDLLLVT